MYRIRKTFKFEASHQLSTAFSKACTDTIHGHSYVAEVFLTSKTLNADGMVLDFGALKAEVGYLFEVWDHALILHSTGCTANTVKALAPTQKKLLLTGYNPTAENMAKHLHVAITKLMKTRKAWKHIKVEKIRIHETATGWAEYEA
jgi:6-pyruvoyltetrahydropterin/6-carboxytetrahydropterin synthase